MNNKLNKLFLVLLVTVSMASCKKEFTPTEDKKTNQTPTNTKDLVVSGNFSWTTNASTAVEITPDVSGLLVIQGEKAETYCKAFLPAGKLYSTRITFPTRITKIYLYYRGNKEEILLNGSGKFISKLK